MVAELDELKKAHYKLIKEYVNILNQASELPFFSVLKFGFLVRIFIESHIKGKLNEIKASYIQLAQTIYADEYRNWHKQTKEELSEFADTLSPWGGMRKIGGILGFLIPWIITILSTILAEINIYELIIKYLNTMSYFLFFTFFIILGALITYPLIFIRNSFRYKHMLFFSGSDGDTNVYKLEDELFKLLEKKKIIEWPVDTVALNILFTPTGIISLMVFFRQESTFTGFARIMLYLVILLSVLLIIIGNYLMIISLKRREEWR